MLLLYNYITFLYCEIPNYLSNIMKSLELNEYIEKCQSNTRKVKNKNTS